MEPRINNGSIALIKQADILADGHIGAFYYDGEVFCKIFRKTKTEVFLESVNKKYSPIYLAENASFKIYVEVIAVLNSVNHWKTRKTKQIDLTCSVFCMSKLFNVQWKFPRWPPLELCYDSYN